MFDLLYNMKRIIISLFFVAVFLGNVYSQRVGIKTNTLLLGTASPNIGMEFGLNKKWSLSVEGSYNPFTFGTDKFWKHWLAQPELRLWYCHRYAGSFFGLHGLYGEYNLSAPNLGLKNRYEGNALGGGLSYGYSWILGNRWNLEVVVGGGYAKLNYTKYECGDCGESLGSFTRNYIGPTRAAVSLIYYIK